MSKDVIMVIIAVLLVAIDLLRAWCEKQPLYNVLACMWAFIAGLWIARMVIAA